jgi:hypothetical protein
MRYQLRCKEEEELMELKANYIWDVEGTAKLLSIPHAKMAEWINNNHEEG